MGKTKKNGRKRLAEFFKDDRVMFIIGILSLSMSIVITLAFISYLFTWKADQSFEWSKVFSGADVSVENWSGKFGAYISNLFMNKWFGLPSFSLPFLLVIIGFRLFGLRLLPLRKTIRVSVAGTILASILLSFLFPNSLFLGSGPGGTHGFVINNWLNSFIGTTGTGFLLLIALVAFLIFSFKTLFLKLKSLFGMPVGEESQSNKVKDVPVDNSMSFEAENIKGDHQEPDGEKETKKEEKQDDFEIIEMEKEPVETPNEKENTNKSEEDDIELTVEEQLKEENVTRNMANPEDLPDYDPTLDLPKYQVPPLDLLEDYQSPDAKVTNEELISNKNKIVETLANYKIQIDKIKATIGPTVTLYEIVPAPGIKISKIKNLEDDIALSLSALGIRIIAPIPGKGTIGIEVPNQKTEIVSMKSILSSKKFQESKFEIPIALGKTISNETYVFDLTKMPHLLVAGATGQGKSVGLNAMITSMLYKKHPAQLKFVMVDPKKVELTLYSKIENHFLAMLPDAEEAIITDTQKVIHTLHSLCIEMDERYDLLKAAFVRNIKEYNQKFISRKLNPEKGHRYLPYIVVIIDEFADLIMTAGKEVETPIARLAQLARAIGIHLIIATQRPTTNIITGVIKANFPARIAFKVSSMIDSRTILDSPGANQLIGRGDMLISQGSDLVRLQCAFLDIPELEDITSFIGEQKGYPSAHQLPEFEGDDDDSGVGEVDLSKRDDMFDEAARLVVIHQQGSTSLIQRKFSIGYNRAGRIIDQLEAAGVVGAFEGSKARQVLIQDEYSLEQLLNDLP